MTVKTHRVQIGQSGTATQNFTLTADAADGTMKLARGNAGATSQDILLVDANGYLSAVQTPALFDNTAKFATTAFVKQAASNMAGYVQYTANTTLTTADLGKYILFQSGTFTCALPDPSTVPTGSRYYIQAGGSAVSVTVTSPVGGFGGPNVTNTGTVVLSSGVASEFISSGSNWIATGGAGIGSTNTGSGYQKFASGVILQWGQIATSATADVAVTYPIAFPTAVVSITAMGATSGLGCMTNYNTSTRTGFNALAFTTAARSAVTYNWMAIGY